MNKQVWGIIGQAGQHFGITEGTVNAANFVKMTEVAPSVDHVAQGDGSWAVPEEKLDELYAAELATLDPLLAHVMRHDFNGEVERKARAELEFEIAQAVIMEKYGKGETVYITETGTCYHRDGMCSALNGHEVREIALSDGLGSYTSCSLCVE